MSDTREEIIRELNSLAELEDEKLVKTYRLLKKVYAKMRKIGSERIRNPVLKFLLKIGDRWLRFRVMRLKKSILETRKEKNKFRYATEEFKRGNNKPVKEIFIERKVDMLALSSSFATYPDLSGGTIFPAVGSARCSRFIEFLGNEEE